MDFIMHNPVWMAQSSAFRMNHGSMMRNFASPNYLLNMLFTFADGVFIIAALALMGIALGNFYSVVMNVREQTSIPKRYNDDKKSKA